MLFIIISIRCYSWWPLAVLCCNWSVHWAVWRPGYWGQNHLLRFALYFVSHRDHRRNLKTFLLAICITCSENIQYVLVGTWVILQKSGALHYHWDFWDINHVFLYKMITVSFTCVVFPPILVFLTHYLLSSPQLLLTYLIIVVALEQYQTFFKIDLYLKKQMEVFLLQCYTYFELLLSCLPVACKCCYFPHC